jgi:tape measure domain-containing protein
MAGGSQYQLELLDKLTRPSRDMSRALKGLGTDAKTASVAAAQATQAVSRLGNASARASRQAAQAAANLRAMAMAAKMSALGAFNRVTGRRGQQMPLDLGKPEFIGPIQSRGGQVKSLIGDLADMNTAAGESISKWGEMRAAFMKTPLGMVASGVGAVAGKIYELGAYLAQAVWSAAKLTYALAALAAVWITKQVVELAMFAERATLSLRQLTGSVDGGARAFTAARRTAMELGADIEETTQQFIDLMAAQFKVGQTEDLVKLAADLATVTGHADGAARAIGAIVKIKSTGRLQGDELMMLAEAGLSLDLVYGNLEKRFGKTRGEILKMQAAGKISAVDAIDAIQKAIMQKVHEQKPGEAASKYAFTTFGGAWKQLQNAPRNFMLRVGERIDTTPLRAGMQKLVDVFNHADGGMLVKFVNAMASGLGRLMEALPYFTEGFAVGAKDLTDAVDRLFKGGNLNETMGKAGKFLGEFLTKSVQLAEKLLPVLGALAEKFAKGFNVESLVAMVEKLDFAKIGQDFGVIAEALGVIYNWVVKLAPYLIGSAQVTAAAASDPSVVGGAFGDVKRATVDASGRSLTAAELQKRVPLSDFEQGEGLLPGFMRWAGGMNPETFYDPTGSTPGFEPNAAESGMPAETGPTASLKPGLLGRGASNNYTAHITVTGSADPQEAARLSEKAARRVFEGFFDRDVAEHA